MTDAGRSERSLVASDDWLPVLEQLLEGFNHTLSNRIAALGGLSQLLEMGLTSRDDGGRSVATEVKLLRDQMELLRSLAATRRKSQDPARAGDGLRLAAQLLQQHRDARLHRYEIADEPADVASPPLSRDDQMRVGVLFLLAASEGSKAEVRVRVRLEAHDGAVRVVATTPVALDQVRGTHSFRALERFAAAAGGACTGATAADGATTLTLVLTDGPRERAVQREG